MKTLILGSTVVDVILRLPRLPRSQESCNIYHQELRLGGCAFNASEALRRFGADYTLFSPVGGGVYGDYVRRELGKLGVASPIPAPESENGCCYCFVEEGGERTFISYHGAEYRFEKPWFDALNAADYGAAYLCALEVEEEGGENLLAFLEAHPDLPVWFAPGPRLSALREERFRRCLALHPALHRNAGESLETARRCGQAAETPEEAAAALHAVTGAPVIVTLGGDGCLYETGTERGHLPPVKTEVADTIGAGDAHVGALMARRALGDDWRTALIVANHYAAAVTAVTGAQLGDGDFAALQARLRREGLL